MKTSRIYKVGIVLVVSLMIEIFVINFGYWKLMLNPEYNKNVVYEQKDISYMGWVQEGDYLISGFDPMFYVNGVNRNVYNIRIEIESFQSIPYTEIFYTNSELTEINEDLHILSNEEFKESIDVKIDSYVKDIRVDLGDLEGIKLKDVKFIFNFAQMEISFARILAINLVYWAYVFLFRLQTPPKYEVE